MGGKISVIIPMFNKQAYIGECIESILMQTYENFEVILIDDGSTDATYSVAKRYQERDPRIRLIRQENAGVSAARNKGLAEAKGEYIAFVDADDCCEKTYLEELISRCGSDTIVVCPYVRLMGNGEKHPVQEKLSPYDAETDSLFETWLIPVLATKETLGSVCRSLFPAKLILENDIRFPPCRIAEDQLFLIRCLQHCKAVAVCPQPLYVYREAEGSATTSPYRAWFLEDRKAYMTILERDLRAMPLSREEYEFLIDVVILNNLNAIFYNAVNAPDRKTENKKIRESVFMRKVSRKNWAYWLRSRSKGEQILAILVLFRLFWVYSALRRVKQLLKRTQK